jgi:hypothetical protein
MFDGLGFVGFFVVYVVLMRWVLPRLASPREWQIRVTSSLDAKLPARKTIVKANRK